MESSNIQISDESLLLLQPNSLIEDSHSTESYLSVIKHMATKALPLSLAIFFFTSNMFFELYFLNQSTSDPDIISAYSLANAFVLLLSLAFISALNNGLVARVSQAFGQGDIRQCGILFHRGLLINICITVPFMIPLIFMKGLLLSLGSTENIANYAQTFALTRLPGAVMSILASSLGALFNGCKVIVVPSLITACTAMLTLLLDWVFLLKLGWGLAGVGISNSFCFTLSFLLSVLYSVIKKPVPGVFFWPVRESFQGIWTLFKYEFTVGAMSWLDYGSGQVTSMISASFSSIELDGMAVSSNINVMLVPIGIALGTVTSSYLGGSMGAGQVKRAKSIIKAGVVLGLGSSMVLMIAGKCLDGVLVNLLASNEEANSYALFLFDWSLLLVPVISIGVILNAAVRTIGKENQGILAVGICDFGIYLPGCFVFAKSLGLGGIGFTVASAISNCLKDGFYAVILMRTKWQDQVEVVRKILAESKSLRLKIDQE